MQHVLKQAAGGGLSRFFQHPFNCAFFRWCHPAVSRAYIRLLGRLYFRRYPCERERYVAPMRSVLGAAFAEREDMEGVAVKMLRGVFDHYYEKLLTAYWGFDRVCAMVGRRVRLVHRHLLDDAMERDRGVILTTAHFGAVEFLPTALAVSGYPVTMAVRYQTRRLKGTLEYLAGLLGIDLLDVDEGAVLVRSMASLRQGRVLIFELDELSSWRTSPAKVMTFFGRRIELDRTVEILQRRSGAPILLGLVERMKGRSYELVFESPREHHPAPTGLGEDAQLLKRLEHYIYTCPDHWYQWKEMGRLMQAAT